MKYFYELLAPVLMKIGEQVRMGCLEEAVENFFVLFEDLARIKDRHGEWFEHMLYGGDLTDMEMLTDAAAELYSHLRQRDDLPEKLGEDMDRRLLSLNERTGFFGDWTVSIYADMLYPMEDLGVDYSDAGKLVMWQCFLEAPPVR